VKIIESDVNIENNSQNSDSVYIDSKKCDLDFLSHQFDISYQVDFNKSIEYNLNSCSISIIVKDKQNGKTRDSIYLQGDYMGRTILENCDDVSSFSTAYKSKHSNPVDNFYGDIVVADFNFDNRDDIAVVSSSGGNGGPQYNFYMQTKNGKFEFDEFLSSAVAHVPRLIDNKTRTLTIYSRVNAFQMLKRMYQLPVKTRAWIIVSSEYIDTAE
jgi:hypothetical protein